MLKLDGAGGVSWQNAYGGAGVEFGYSVQETADGEQLMAVTPMHRVKGFNPEAGDWFWAKYDAAGKVAGCINCHQARAAENWIFAEPQ